MRCINVILVLLTEYSGWFSMYEIASVLSCRPCIWAQDGKSNKYLMESCVLTREQGRTLAVAVGLAVCVSC